MTVKNPWKVNLDNLVEFYGLTRQTIKKRLTHSDCPREVKISRGQYDLKIFNDFIVAHFYGSQDISRQMAEEKLRYQKYRSDTQEMEAKSMAKELLPVKEIQISLSFVFTGIKRKFLGWVKRLPPLLKGHNEKEMGQILKSEIRILLNDLSMGVSSIIPKRQRGRPKTIN